MCFSDTHLYHGKLWFLPTTAVWDSRDHRKKKKSTSSSVGLFPSAITTEKVDWDYNFRFSFRPCFLFRWACLIYSHERKRTQSSCFEHMQYCWCISWPFRPVTRVWTSSVVETHQELKSPSGRNTGSSGRSGDWTETGPSAPTSVISWSLMLKVGLWPKPVCCVLGYSFWIPNLYLLLGERSPYV